jgi:P-type conjugative transfer protein TrbJ
MSMKKFVVIVMTVFCLSFGAYTPKAHAGIPVIDIAGLLEAILTFITTLEEVYASYEQIDNQINQIQNQVRGLEMQAKNLQKMDLAKSLKNISTLRGNMNKIKQLHSTSKAIPLQYDSVLARREQIYKKVDKEYKAYSGSSLAELKGQAAEILTQTSEAARDAMMAQGLIVDIETDEVTLEELLANSDTAEGALEASQVNNQLVALQTNQMMRLQVINAASARLQASQYDEQVQKKLMTEAESDRFNERKNKDNPLQGGGNGPGFVDFK